MQDPGRINWLDKEIFTRHRKAYPIKLRATDEEDSHVDQTAGGDSGPLQSKAIFFDNKRMIDNDEMCDGLTLKWKRSVRTYYPETFTVRISEKRGKCYLSFKEYTASRCFILNYWRLNGHFRKSLLIRQIDIF